MTHITDLNIYISSFLQKTDVVSFLKSSIELRNDLYNIPFKSFVLTENFGMNEIKAMMCHLDVIEILEINNCEFVDQLLLPMKKLKYLTLIRCDVSDKRIEDNHCFENVTHLTLKNCKNIYSLIKDYPKLIIINYQ